MDARTHAASIVSGRRSSNLELAERHVAEGETRVARQRQIITTLEQDNHPRAAARGRAILVTLEATLVLMRRHLEELRRGASCP